MKIVSDVRSGRYADENFRDAVTAAARVQDLRFEIYTGADAKEVSKGTYCLGAFRGSPGNDSVGAGYVAFVLGQGDGVNNRFSLCLRVSGKDSEDSRYRLVKNRQGEAVFSKFSDARNLGELVIGRRINDLCVKMQKLHNVEKEKTPTLTVKPEQGISIV